MLCTTTAAHPNTPLDEALNKLDGHVVLKRGVEHPPYATRQQLSDLPPLILGHLLDDMSNQVTPTLYPTRMLTRWHCGQRMYRTDYGAVCGNCGISQFMSVYD